MAEKDYRLGWTEDDEYWRTNYSSRPYASTGRKDYTFYQPAYRYGYESAHRHEGRSWSDIEPQLSTDWLTWENRTKSTWEEIKGAVRDAWDRVTNKRPVGTR